MRRTLPDTRDDLIVQRFGNGVKLIEPTKKRRNSLLVQPEKSIKQLIDYLPCNVFFTGKDIIFNANHKAASLVNLEVHEFVKKSILQVTDKPSARIAIHNNIQVMQQNKIKIVEEIISQQEDVIQSCLSIKFPWYNQAGKTVGVFGFAIVYGRDNFAETITQLHELGMLNSSCSLFRTLQIDNVNFSIRESECIQLTIRGKTAKEIAHILGLSKRTVEFYLENIKHKLNVYTKGELVDKVIHHLMFQ